MYILRANIPPVEVPSSSITGTSNSCMQMAQSKTRLPFFLLSLAIDPRLAIGEVEEVEERRNFGEAGAELEAADENPIGRVAPSASSRSTGW